MAAAIRSGKRSGVQAKTGMPMSAMRWGVAVLVAGRSVVGEREQADDLHARGDETRPGA